MTLKKGLGRVVLLLIVLSTAFYLWNVYLNFRFAEVSEAGSSTKVYQSALIPPDKIGAFLEKGKIKTVINLLDASVQTKLNPAQQSHIDDEDKAVLAYNQKNSAEVQHINIPSGQVPNKNTLKAFFEVLDKKENYPVLIHCYHGTGRTELYSALFRIEFENWKNKDARAKTRVVVEGLGYTSSFGKGREKGDFLINYKQRSDKNSTLNTIK
ncbi:MAG: hypothetical protein V3V19_00165 [Cocleimonas sp.]